MAVELDQISQLSGLLGLLNVIVVLFWGFLVLYKAVTKKQKILYYFFLAIILTVSAWYPCGFGYLYWLITKEIFTYHLYVLMGMIGIPIALYAWLEIYLTAIYQKIKKKILISYLIFAMTFYIYLIYYLFFVPNAPMEEMIGIKQTPLDINYKGYILIFIAISLITGTLSGIHFSYVSMKIKENVEVKWKGRFLMLSFILFAIGVIGDALIELTAITLILIRIILILSGTFYYIGFIMPKWIKKTLSFS
jgi:hypothetical protein